MVGGATDLVVTWCAAAVAGGGGGGGDWTPPHRPAGRGLWRRRMKAAAGDVQHGWAWLQTHRGREHDLKS